MTLPTGVPPDDSTDARPDAPSFGGHVVCLGASAGGLDALERFFKACPTDLGVAYVVVQHLSPDHKSMMGNLLARYTTMPVVMVEDAMVIEPDQVYLIPPGSVMRVTEGLLHLTPKSPHGLTLPIDIFFTSLSESFGGRAVGIVLSGTGTDGSKGVVSIRSAGGMVLVQEPESAKFDGMPRSAIASGAVNAVLPVEELPARLQAHVMGLDPPPAPSVSVLAALATQGNLTNDELIVGILQLVHEVCGIDFTEYKAATVLRRIERRLQVRHCLGLREYLDLLENERAELLTLRREMLISVTSFFRDPEAFAVLADQVVRPLAERPAQAGPIRVWTAGVASGEEAYTLAMLFLEAFERAGRWPALKIFATDVDQSCVDAAGLGQYPESAAAELSAERLERFFIRKDDHFVVRNELRQCIVFARHNLLSDPPFTNMDLVVCRNTLIYFKSAAQERALRSLHYAVRPGGAVMLGSSESVLAVTDGLQPVNAKHKIFLRTTAVLPPVVGRRRAPMALSGGGLRAGSGPRTRGLSAEPQQADPALAQLLQKYVPPAVLVNARHEVVHLYGDVRSYFQPREGSASLELHRILPESISPVAAALLYKVSREPVTHVSGTLELTLSAGTSQSIRLSVHPVAADGEDRVALLCFEPVARASDTAPSAVDVDAETSERLSVLERELAATRESLQATIEALETSNEELQATNEELMASNEELQSSNEELQSVNEELSTVNFEFQEKVQILDRLNADLDGLAKAAGIPTIFVDASLQIKRFSPDATRVFKLRDSDVGRPLDDITHTLAYPDLMTDLEETLRTERMIEREVRSAGGEQTYLVRILPYAIPSSDRRGAVATFVDMSAFHDARRLQRVIDALAEHVAVVDTTGVITMVNAPWRRFARANGDPELVKSGVGANYLQACLGDASDVNGYAAQAYHGLKGVLEGSIPFFTLPYPCHSPTEERWFVMSVAPIAGDEMGAVVSHVNITAWREERAWTGLA